MGWNPPAFRRVEDVNSYHFVNKEDLLEKVVEQVLADRGSDGRPVFAERDTEPAGELLAILRAGQTSGEFREFDPVVIAMTVTQAIDGAVTRWAEHPETDLTSYAEELVTLFRLATESQEH